MKGFDKPKPPIPDSLRGAEEGTFTHYTITVRFANIVRQVLDDNQFTGEILSNLQALIGEIPTGSIRALRDTTAPDTRDWLEYIAAQQDNLPETEVVHNEPWLQVPWFFVETYFYRRILEASGYFQPGPGLHKDPYLHQKRQGLENGRQAMRSTASKLNQWLDDHRSDKEETLNTLLVADLWGNQADLSMWPAGGDKEGPNHQKARQQKAHLLVDETQALVNHLLALRPHAARIDILADNAGLELANDLFLADYLLASEMIQTIHLHLKPHPTFVSDAMIKDVRDTISFLKDEGDLAVQAVGQRLQDHLGTGGLRLLDHYFWTSPLSGWEMPAELKAYLAGSDLIISKGDANYRRLLGDRHWPFTTPLKDILRYMPAPLAALRVLKSEVAAGHPPGQPEEMAGKDSDWLTNGNWAVIQFVGME